MDGAERVVDVEVLAAHQLVYERRVIGFLTRIEAEVLHDPYPRDQDFRHELLQALTHRRHGERRVHSSPGAPEVAADRHLRIPLQEPLERRQQSPDTEVVCHLRPAGPPGAQGDIQVGPQKHVCAARVG